MKRRDRPFAAGRRTGKASTLFFLSDLSRPSIPGPWTIRAVVAARRPAGEPARASEAALTAPPA